MTAPHWRRCQAGYVEHLDRLYGPQPEKKTAVATRAVPRLSSPQWRIGDRLKNIILTKTGVSVPCSECQSDIAALNHMSPDVAKKKIEDFTEKIFQRASEKAHRWHQKLAVKFAPEFVKSTIRGWIMDAIEAAEKEAPDRHSGTAAGSAKA